MLDIELLRQLAAVSSMSDAEVEAARAHRDYDDSGSLDYFEKRHPKLTPPLLQAADLAALVSAEARAKVIEFEVSSERLYERKYAYPTKPGADSGITIGIGYDLGHNDAAKARSDLAGLFADSDLDALLKTCGLKRGEAAAALPHVRHIRLPWAQALQLFDVATIPRYAQLVRTTFPNADETAGHAFGALFSLVYNRGSSLQGERRKEMAAIYDLMDKRSFAGIPAQFLAMKAIWQRDPDCAGLLKRRDAEAALFKSGLKQIGQPVVAAASSAVDPTEHLEANRTEEELRYLEGDGFNYHELDDTDAGPLESSGNDWDKAKWIPDEKSPDYSHIADRTLSATAFAFGPGEIELLIEANSFKPSREHGRIVFALRGAKLVKSLQDTASVPRQENSEALFLCDQRPDHKTQCCVIGVYDATRGRLSAYPGSTVPNGKAIASYVNGGDASNMMMTGCFTFKIGWHQQSQAIKKIPGCLIEAGRQKAVRRSKEDFAYDLVDAVDNSHPAGDNLHPAKREGPFPFSSWGCLVVDGSVDPLRGGDRSRVTHTGDWGRFRKALGLAATGTGEHGRDYDVILLTGLEAAIAHKAIKLGSDPAADAARSSLIRLRQGSAGPRVAKLRNGLRLADGNVFDHQVAVELVKKQRGLPGAAADGIYSPASDTQLGYGVFVETVASNHLERFDRSSAHAVGGDEEHDGLAYELGYYDEARRRGAVTDGEHLESFTDTVVQYGSAALISAGNVLMREAELVLRGYVCQCDGASRFLDRDTIRDRVDSAAKASLGNLKHVLIVALKTASFAFIPERTLERLVSYIVDQIVVPNTTGAAVIQRIDGGVDWLCQRWDERLVAVYGVASAGGASGRPAGDMQQAGDQGAAPPPPMADQSTGSPAVEHLALIEKAALSETIDAQGVRRFIHELRDAVNRGSVTLSPEDTRRFLNLLCDSRFMEQLSGTIATDPYRVMKDLEDAANGGPPCFADFDRHFQTLLKLLGDARITIDKTAAVNTLNVLKSRRKYHNLAVLSDRFITRDQAISGDVSPYYAQGLIDSGCTLAGIEVINKALKLEGILPAVEAELKGLLGRANKQIYVNHVRSVSDAIALGKSYATNLKSAIENYRAMFDPAKPGELFWHGINYMALLSLAAGDRVPLATGHPDPVQLAKDIAAALEADPKADRNDPWWHASLGEAYLGAGDIDSASRHYGAFAGENTDAFALNSALRQLEQVWRIEGAATGAGAIVLNLKSVLAERENGTVVLSRHERKELAGAEKIEHEEHFETRTPDGKQVALTKDKLMKKAVRLCGAVAAIRKQGSGMESGDIVGTGFLINGAEFGYPADKSYVITNAHVVWNPAEGDQTDALQPGEAIISFDDDEDTPDCWYRAARVLWQSPRSVLDATIIELDRKVPLIQPLMLGADDTKLSSADPATILAVIGHPEGRELTFSFSLQSTLIDMGPKGETKDPIYLHYKTSTEGGNSGSPVFDLKTWRVVGLHHAGFNERQGRPKLGGKVGANFANEGIYIGSIKAAASVPPPAPPPIESAPKARRWGRR